MRVILQTKPRKNPHIPIEAEAVIPQNFLRKNDIRVYEGNKERKLEEIFYITTEGPAVSPDQVEIVLAGETGTLKRVGEYMNAGRIVVEGDIGMHCGNFMSAGEIIIRGNADAWLGREMRGGMIRCEGNAGHYCAAGYRGEKRGMRGGTVEVMGNSGDFTAEYLCGGEVRIHGDCGDLTGVEMRGGTLIIGGNCHRPCGNMTGGTCMIFGNADAMLPTFRSNGIEEREYEGQRFQMMVFRGDVANRGKGTLLIRKK
ncbi:MAG: formylmethanofuran dehydrogenase subunit C [Methanoregulaceae archaeon]|jgi:formylmethanofuran dehydrogenase subunit C|nr:formylmethanofuran dehydrogenase subunit C [Methanoregulaceae archaeon]MCU0628564.1 formylmethanofuran dehydrogenase subunit C [Methanoregulaceae archaeon]